VAIDELRSKRGTRQRGEKTRLEILDAALRVIAREGVRGVSHRAVAQEAGVNLSLTTYYFVNLTELIASAFRRFLQSHYPEINASFEQGFRYIDKLGAQALADVEGRRRLRDYLQKRICRYVEDKITQYPEAMAAEHHFFFEVLHDEGLIELANEHRRRLTEPFIALCERLGSSQPAVDADLLLGTILRLEYEQLVHPGRSPDMRRIRAAVGRVLGWILRID
jgi:AcrR family transcriptional regulator